MCPEEDYSIVFKKLAFDDNLMRKFLAGIEQQLDMEVLVWKVCH